MRIWFDTEFYEDGSGIDLISIGMVRADGATYYAETPNAFRLSMTTDWLATNVSPHLQGGRAVKQPQRIASDIVTFAGAEPEFWAYYGAYDWVVLCQLYGTMMDLPFGWPKFVRDVKQLATSIGDPDLPAQEGPEHCALADALWTRYAWDYLVAEGARP